jgi:hypothetical protein
MCDDSAQSTLKLSLFQVVEIGEKQLVAFIPVEVSAGRSFTVYRDNTKDANHHIIFQPKRLSVFRAKTQNEALEKCQHFEKQSMLFGFVGSFIFHCNVVATWQFKQRNEKPLTV